MASNTEFHLLVFGLPESELRLVRAISTISKTRKGSRTYVLADATAPATADFAIVDGDDPEALAQWQAFQAAHPMVPATMVGGAADSKLTEFRIGRPLMATRLHTVLNRMQVSNERPALAPQKVSDTVPAPPARPPAAEQSSPANSGAAVRKALVVDDSLPIRRQMEQELHRFVDAVDLAQDGEQAIELLSANRYDIVFLDVVLPGMNGYEICKRIKRDKRTRATPVIMLTGKSSPFDRIKGKLAGCNTYLSKPVNQAKFDKVMQTLDK